MTNAESPLSTHPDPTTQLHSYFHRALLQQQKKVGSSNPALQNPSGSPAPQIPDPKEEKWEKRKIRKKIVGVFFKP